MDRTSPTATRLLATALAALLTLGLLASPALADGGHDDGPPPHGHLLLLGATFTVNPGPAGPPVFIHSYQRCVELAAGRPVPNQAHHDGVHTGAAGSALRTHAGHLVVPLTPVGPGFLTGCDAAPALIVPPLND